MNLQIIKNFIEDRSGIEDIASRNRYGILPKTRVLFSVLASEYTSATYEEIGSYIGRDHSSVSHYIKIRNQIYDFPILERAYKEFQKSYSQIVLQGDLVPDSITEALSFAVEENIQLKEEKFLQRITKREKEEALSTASTYLAELTEDMTEEQLEKLKIRVEPIINMIKSERYIKPKLKEEIGIL